VSELESSVSRLTAIIAHADEADAALQAAVSADGGAALTSYSNGTASDQPIARLIATQENSAKAAAAAKPALEKARVQLETCRAQVAALEKASDDAIIHYLKRRAGEDVVAPYLKTFRELCATHDRLCGIGLALSANGHAELVTAAVPIQVPGFNTAPNPGPSERIVMQHLASEFTTSAATAKWMQAREKLRGNPDADIDNLIGLPTYLYPADADL
jgi:hypothetical protein